MNAELYFVCNICHNKYRPVEERSGANESSPRFCVHVYFLSIRWGAGPAKGGAMEESQSKKHRMLDCPVIAVPTSVGYGASFGGLSALLSMLNSCASGCSVVNIDNGFGAGYLANMINHMEVKG